MQDFRSAYKTLNPKQKEAVDTIEGPVMVVAGPGTGKTQILTLRIANILKKTDTAPDSILALTFTESGVFSMRKRLVELIGSDGYRVPIYTFHGFCNEVIKEHPDEFPRIIGATNLTEVDKISLLKDIIATTDDINTLRPFGDTYFYVGPIKSQISELKRENINPDNFLKRIVLQEKEFETIADLHHEKGKYNGAMKGKYRDLQKKIEKNKELNIVYKQYEKRLAQDRLYDFEDMILEVIRALKENEDLLLKLQEEYQYFLADEHQDANNAQNELLELLASFHERPNIFVVGDEKQAIFRFQGASLENFLYFKHLYPDAKLIKLQDNYRSTQEILNSAHSLISSTEDKEGLRIPLLSKKTGKGVSIEVFAFSKPELEYLYVAKDIKEKIDQGVPAHELAVLYRNNRDAEPLARVFEKIGVPYVIESDSNILHDNDIQKLVTILEAIYTFGNDRSLISFFHIDFIGVENLDLYKLTAYARKERMSYHDVLASADHLKQAKIKEIKEFRRWYTILSAWHTKAFNMDLLDFLDLVIHESGFLTHILSSEFAIEKLEKVTGFFSDAQTVVESHHTYKLPEFMNYLAMLSDHNISIRKSSRNVTPREGVRLMTAHRSKGLEFDYVYVIDVHDGHWGNKRSIQYFKMPQITKHATIFDENDDERRLFYVAITRARLGASLLYAVENQDGKPQLPSIFLEEIGENHLHEVDTASFESSVDTTTLLAPNNKVAVPPLKDKQFLNELFLEQGLSVTALNNYLDCPWNYFYSNLLRIPKPLNKHLMFGSAVHHTLKYFFDALAKGDDIGPKKLVSVFEDNARRQPFNEVDLKEAIMKGKTALEGYYKRYHKEWITNVTNEFRITTLFPADIRDVGRLKLRGDLDKVEFLTDREVNVVDYKTGRPKTRNMIEGKTKSSNGNYKRQLVFYNLLLNLYEGGKFSMVSAEVDFVEPDTKGRYHKEQFVITPSDVGELKQQIAEVAQEILDLSFWDKICDNKKCEYCKLRQSLN